MLGVTGGVGFSEAEIFKNTDYEEIDTPFGKVKLLITKNLAFIPRHGIQSRVPPHMINHRANIHAFKAKGISQVIGMNSVGSLNIKIQPPSIIVPHDYINLWGPATFYDDRIVHIIPALDEELRKKLILLAEKIGLEVMGSGVYIQTNGPRLETKAEVRLLANFGDVVGMTMASEATLAKELDLNYASICSIDNYAHGIVDEPLTSENILKNARENSTKISNFILKAAEEFQ